MQGRWWRGAQPLASVLQEVERVLRANLIEFEFDNHFSFICDSAREDDTSVCFEVEVCRLQRMNLLSLRFKRISGSFWSYQRLCSKLIAQLVL